MTVFQAFKLVEVRVRQLSGYGDGDYGVDMMQRAFKPGGPLADPGQQPGEQDAIRPFDRSSRVPLGCSRTPGSHRIVKWDPAEAAEVVYLANTLLRMLGRIETRLTGDAVNKGSWLGGARAREAGSVAHESAQRHPSLDGRPLTVENP